MKKKLLSHNLFALASGNWYLGWWFDNGAKLPEFHSQVYPNQQEAELKLNQLKSKFTQY